ncbi:hypothetical protein EYF80_053196 [Liparis tanakae]|uniref:Uncharacterized protein n=1 Tax=Liparis tanakae TaxID=230148 RepID=A0A4Z2F636_9TELE|nr:hypothetical protein EYF80_053196 [Liparis tanakae]
MTSPRGPLDALRLYSRLKVKLKGAFPSPSCQCVSCAAAAGLREASAPPLAVTFAAGGCRGAGLRRPWATSSGLDAGGLDRARGDGGLSVRVGWRPPPSRGRAGEAGRGGLGGPGGDAASPPRRWPSGVLGSACESWRRERTERSVTRGLSLLWNLHATKALMQTGKKSCHMTEHAGAPEEERRRKGGGEEEEKRLGNKKSLRSAPLGPSAARSSALSPLFLSEEDFLDRRSPVDSRFGPALSLVDSPGVAPASTGFSAPDWFGTFFLFGAWPSMFSSSLHVESSPRRKWSALLLASSLPLLSASW